MVKWSLFTLETAQSDTQLDMILYTKFNLSKEPYHELSMVCHDLPRYSKLRKWIQELNKKWDIAPCPANLGVQQSLKLRLMVRIWELINCKRIDPSNDTVIAVKLNGDGTNFG